jgi:hypothetical protein
VLVASFRAATKTVGLKNTIHGDQGVKFKLVE